MCGDLSRYTFLSSALIAVCILLGDLSPVWAQRAAARTRPRENLSAAQLVHQGKTQFQNRRFALAIRSLSAAIRKEGRVAEAFLFRGRAYDQIGQHKRAEKDFTTFIGLRPSDPEGYIRRGDTRNFNLDHQTALEDYNRAVKLAPSSVTAHLGRGLAYAGLEKYDLAMKDYQWVLKLDPTNHEALGNMGIACMLAGRRLEAVTYFERALKVEKDPQWLTRIEKWIAKLLDEADKTTAKNRGPARTPPGTTKPLW